MSARARSFPCGAMSCSTPTRPCRRSPSCAAARSRSCSSPRPPAARPGRATRSSAPSHAARGGSATASSTSGCPSAAGTASDGPPIRSPTSATGCASIEPVDVPELGAFWSGAVGFFGYDVVRLIERLPHPPPRSARRSRRAVRAVTRAVVIIDNLRAQARIVVGVPVEASLERTSAPIALRRSRARDRRPGRAASRACGAAGARCRDVTRHARRPQLHQSAGLRGARAAHQGVHRGRRCVPGAARAAIRDAARLRSRNALSRAARAESIAVHVPPRARRHGARRVESRAARARCSGTRHRASHRRHASARPHA